MNDSFRKLRVRYIDPRYNWNFGNCFTTVEYPIISSYNLERLYAAVIRKNNTFLFIDDKEQSKMNDNAPLNMPKFYYKDEIASIKSNAFMWGWIFGCAVCSSISVAMIHWGII